MASSTVTVSSRNDPSLPDSICKPTITPIQPNTSTNVMVTGKMKRRRRLRLLEDRGVLVASVTSLTLEECIRKARNGKRLAAALCNPEHPPGCLSRAFGAETCASVPSLITYHG